MQRRLVGLVFAKPQSKNDPARLHLLIQVIDGNWFRFNVDVKGKAYEGPLNAVAGKVDSVQALVR
jgi:hypothetical protein